jgi:hypothetical protein
VNNQFSKPKGFGEILDYTFRLSKYNFKDFFTILLLLVGPVYILQAVIDLASGKSFFRQEGGGGTWYEDFLLVFASEEAAATNLAADIGLGIATLIMVITYPVAQAAILFAVNHIKNNEEFTIGQVIKQAFGRFWGILGATFLFILIFIGLIIAFIISVPLFGLMFGIADFGLAIIFVILSWIALLIVGAYLLTRWSFYFGSVVLDRTTPGFIRSWRLTKGRTFQLMGLYFIFFLIITSISFAIELSFMALLGNSVLLGLVVSFVTLFTTLIMSVGYAVMYMDLKLRHDPDDLKDLIDDYHHTN